MSEDVDRALVARIAGGDRAAFEAFYDRYARRVLAFVSDLIADAALAEETAGDVMLAAWRGARSFRGASRVSTWLLGIAHHKAMDALRRRRAAPLPLDELDGTVGDGDPESIVIQSIDRATLEAALTTLSPEHREVLQLMYGFECSQAEIAEIARIPLATVKTRVFYAKRRLRDAITATHAAEHIA